MYPNYQNQNQTYQSSQPNLTQSGYQSFNSNYPPTNMYSSLNIQPSYAQQPYSNNYQPYSNNYQPNTNSFVVEQVQYQSKQYGIGTGLDVNSNNVGFGNTGLAILGNTQINNVISEPEVRRKQSQTIDPQSYNQLTYYQFHTINHLFRTITMNHCRMIKKTPYIQVAINAISFVLNSLQDQTSPYRPLLQSLFNKFSYSLTFFTNNQGSSQPAKTYYQIQSWMIIMITVYKCIQDGYDTYTRKMFKNVCSFFANSDMKNPESCVRWLENNRKQILDLEDMKTFMNKSSSIIYEIYQDRASFLKAKQLDEVPNFRLINLATFSQSRRKVVNIWISGFLSEDMDKKSHWQSLSKLMPDSEIYAVQWASDCITNLIKFIGKACFQVLTADSIKSELHKKFSDNPFIPAIQVSIILGKYLAQMLVRLFPNQFINIVGYSLASEMILACLDRMIQVKRQSMLNNVYLLGGVTDCGQFENVLRKSRYPLTIHNCYTANDLVLKHVLSLCKPENKPVGLQEIKKVQGHDINNVDCSQFVSGHLAYMQCFSDVGRMLEMAEE